VNGFSKYDKSFNPPLSQWQGQLNEQGQYPAANTSHLKITSDNGTVTESDDAWT
jgi:hypothetical protein